MLHFPFQKSQKEMPKLGPNIGVCYAECKDKQLISAGSFEDLNQCLKYGFLCFSASTKWVPTYFPIWGQFGFSTCANSFVILQQLLNQSVCLLLPAIRIWNSNAKRIFQKCTISIPLVIRFWRFLNDFGNKRYFHIFSGSLSWDWSFKF